MSKVILAAVVVVALSCASVWLVHGHLVTLGYFADKPAIRSFQEFDFPGYAFGIVAVAITFAGVYVSVVPSRLSDQLANSILPHFCPDPFPNPSEMESKCHPDKCIAGFERTEGVECVFAIVTLVRWKSLSKGQKTVCLGNNGIGQVRQGISFPCKCFQLQIDRYCVVLIAAVVSTLYALLPIAYMFRSQQYAVAMIFVIYGASLLEMLLCFLMFVIRSMLVDVFEGRINSWRIDLKNHLFAAQQQSVPSSSSLVV